MSILIKGTNIETLLRAMLMFYGHEIVEISDHGDLIEKDPLLKKAEELEEQARAEFERYKLGETNWEQTERAKWRIAYLERIRCKHDIADTPVVIPAERSFSPVKPITNADKIRQMSDDELAEFLAKQEYKKPTFDGWVPLCNRVMGARICHENGCRKCWLDWLKQNVERSEE